MSRGSIESRRRMLELIQVRAGSPPFPLRPTSSRTERMLACAASLMKMSRAFWTAQDCVVTVAPDGGPVRGLSDTRCPLTHQAANSREAPSLGRAAQSQRTRKNKHMRTLDLCCAMSL